jgi:disulfide bond formation protein DsbB
MLNFRTLYTLGFLMCVVMMGTALLFFQRFLGLEPCPLCILQRVVVISLGIVLLVAAIQGPSGWGNRLYGALIMLIAGAGAAVAGRHLWLQSLPADQVPECGPTLDYILEVFPLSKALQLVLRGSGECAKIEWQFLGLSIPGWTLIAFSGFILFGLILLLHPRRARPAE